MEKLPMLRHPEGVWRIPMTESTDATWQYIYSILEGLDDALGEVQLVHEVEHSLVARFHDVRGNAQVLMFGVDEKETGFFRKKLVQEIAYLAMSQADFEKFGLEGKRAQLSGAETIVVDSKFETSLRRVIDIIIDKVGLELDCWGSKLLDR